MTKITRSIQINAPVEKVFAYMNQPTNLPDIWPNMVEVKDVQILPNGGASFKYAYKAAGFRLESFSEDTEYILNERTVSKSSGGIDGTSTFIYDTTAQGTNVTYVNEYKIPIPLVGKIAESAISKLATEDTVTLLNNLKTKMEAELS
jgi:uncharacterized membrane protein